MAYFPDLSDYTYWTHEPGKNVGWLSGDHPFETGPVPDEALRNLRVFCEYPVNGTFGFHICEFCPDADFNAPETRSTCEVRVFGQDGEVYCAPYLILHYIEAHRYKPPEAFILALMTGPLPPSDAYYQRLEAIGNGGRPPPELRHTAVF